MADNIHDVQIDPRNLNILISVNGTLTPRAEAMISVFRRLMEERHWLLASRVAHGILFGRSQHDDTVAA